MGLDAASLESLRALISDELDFAAFEHSQSGHVWEIASKQLKSRTITRAIIAAVIKWARANQYECAFEVRLPGITRNNNMRAVLDVVLKGAKTKPDLIAVEIDRGNKSWSIKKLAHAVSLGYAALWIKWGGPIRIDVPSQIAVLYIPLQYAS